VIPQTPDKRERGRRGERGGGKEKGKLRRHNCRAGCTPLAAELSAFGWLCSQVSVGAAAAVGKAKVYGPALEKPVKMAESTYIIVDCKEAGPGEYIHTWLDGPS